MTPTPITVRFVPRRRRLADSESHHHKFQIGPCEGYVTVGLYEDGQPGEIFITLAKEGSAIAGLVDSFATAISISLQYGVPLKILCNKFIHAHYEPSGQTQNPNIPQAKSIVDYIFRWLALKFLSPEERQLIGMYQETKEQAATPTYEPTPSFLSRFDTLAS